MGSWTQEQSIAFEAARECITDMMGICSAALEDEESKVWPNPIRVAELERELAGLAQERARLSVHDSDRIATIRSEYGARIRAYRQHPRQEAA